MTPPSSGSKNKTRKKLAWKQVVSRDPCLAYSWTLKIEAICCSEKSVVFQRTTLRYIAEDGTLNMNLSCENAKPSPSHGSPLYQHKVLATEPLQHSYKHYTSLGEIPQETRRQQVPLRKFQLNWFEISSLSSGFDSFHVLLVANNHCHLSRLQNQPPVPKQHDQTY
jgi:hypothetical protein